MPNYCDNTLRVHAKGDVLKLAKSLIFKDSEPKESNFSFTCAKPMPEEIRHTNSPNRVISDEEYAQRVKDGTTTEEPGGLFTAHYNTEAQLYNFRTKYGATNWYDWAVLHWGTKWDADAYAISEDDNSIVVHFSTAWSPPAEWFETFCGKFHNEAITIELEYSEEGMGFAGRYTFCDGEIDHCDGEIMMVCELDDQQVTYNAELERWTNDDGDIVDDDYVVSRVIF